MRGQNSDIMSGKHPRVISKQFRITLDEDTEMKEASLNLIKVTGTSYRTRDLIIAMTRIINNMTPEEIKAKLPSE